MKLIDALRKTSSVASKMVQKQKRSEEDQCNKQRIQQDLKEAQKLIRDLPQLLKRAAEQGYRSIKVMELEKGFHCDWDEQAVTKECSLHGASSDVIRHGAWEVIKWLTEQGLTVTMGIERQNDKGQGRSWNDLYIFASW